jgi:plasmid stabilization system protein ParE
MGRWRAMLDAHPAHYETTAKTDKTSQDQYRTTGFVSFDSQSVVTANDVFDAAEAEYDRIGAEIDALADQAKAARERGDAAEGERLGAQVRRLVAGPYRQARERYAALLGTEGAA